MRHPRNEPWPAEVKTRAMEMRAKGFGPTPIHRELGVPMGTLRLWLYDPDGTKSQVRKARCAPKCVDCGKRLNGSNGQGPNAAERCNPCDGRHKMVWTEGEIVAAIRRFAERYGRKPRAADFMGGNKSSITAAHRERFYADGDYPYEKTVWNRFGSFNAAVEAAGFTPTPPGRYALNPRPGDLKALGRAAA